MTRIFMLCAVLAAAGTAQAQAQPEPSTAAFLEKRVPDELAVEGVMLSRRNLSLKIEPVGDQVVISLVELSTGRVVASTKLDALPADREAAVAAVTHVAADLSRQVGPAAPAESREDHVRDEVAEQRYREDELRFGERYELEGTAKSPTLTRTWVVYRGEQNHEVDPAAFYTAVGRPDFARSYEDRISKRNTAVIAGGALAVGSLAVFAIGAIAAASESSGPTCSVSMSFGDFDNCVREGMQAQERGRSDMMTALVPSILLAAGAIISFGVAVHYHHTAHPVSEDQAMSLADAYNHGLRHRLGLPTSADPPAISSLQVSPFTTRGTDGGIALGGSF